MKGGKRLCELGAQVKSFGAYSLNNEVAYLESGIPFIRGVNMKNGRVNFTDMQFISSEAHALLWKSEVKEGMILLSMSGTIGDVAIATPNWIYPINSNQDIAKIDTKGTINPYILYTFLISRYGQNYLQREARGSVQQHVFLSQIEQIEIPTFDFVFESRIQSIIEQSENGHLNAEKCITNAENSLIMALSLDTWSPPEPLSYTRSSSEVFNTTRLDAEHFQPRFQSLVELIDETGAGTKLGKHLLNNKRGKQPTYADEGLPVVNSKHVLRNDVRLDADNRMAISEEGDLLIHPGDVLINGTGVGTIGRSAAYLHESLAIPDNHVTILRPDEKLDPVYLALFLNSKAGQFQVEQRLRGSSGQIELYPNDIAEFSIWLAPTTLQQSIRQQVEQSFAQRQNAARLLDAAKRAVEIAIEESEAAAVAYLDNIVE
ncbi:restriction endonuclease subunit S [Aeromonas caviae]|nr:restriction endonuclease subunit S [Aeromonas caviae]